MLEDITSEYLENRQSWDAKVARILQQLQRQKELEEKVKILERNKKLAVGYRTFARILQLQDTDDASLSASAVMLYSTKTGKSNVANRAIEGLCLEVSSSKGYTFEDFLAPILQPLLADIAAAKATTEK
jgi:2-hydroxy-3-keto-5-methylthiopentenyl-1-phosphate phosphatase